MNFLRQGFQNLERYRQTDATKTLPRGIHGIAADNNVLLYFITLIDKHGHPQAWARGGAFPPLEML